MFEIVQESHNETDGHAAAAMTGWAVSRLLLRQLLRPVICANR